VSADELHALACARLLVTCCLALFVIALILLGE
jgi:hypothetical protein